MSGFRFARGRVAKLKGFQEREACHSGAKPRLHRGSIVCTLANFQIRDPFIVPDLAAGIYRLYGTTGLGECRKRRRDLSCARVVI